MTDQQPSDQQPSAGRPVLRVVRGEPDDAELAALAAVFAASSAGEPAEAAAPERSGWADRAALLRRPLSPGAGAWRWSAFRG
ncbi:acyl-CoA carboxylase epsilon subunit [Actinoalloteichus hymeniacidonis]|uniref:Acyl-CoA carboxylase epsilon subunit n=1 Tax=Actinoalloteichus hymeniacidonis TaxID=340345 RepID=A0AAC9N0L7_9PSEU|nr:acyl-CoA carboxylase epsilon subunit [Actinoalloteichus hymeniacidonis]AOS65505.1 Acyl-CoA carboxylase epsilon subunit [Actinoalloteichus hymeniacidonis]MBB5906408.1 hypothetical protein [Actinoalloteichus hymeniacidonis]